jgi:hypothetical protein
VESLAQNSVWIEAGGTLILASENPQLYAATAQRNYALAVPEPASVVSMALGCLWIAGHRTRTRKEGADSR